MTEETPRLYVEPGKADVLCGRGGKQFNHPGNHILRVMIAACLDSYISVRTRRDRGTIIASIATKIMNQGGRFLLFDKVATRWFDGGMKAARHRIGSAFRDGSKPGKVKLMESLKASLTTTQIYSSLSSSPPLPQCHVIPVVGSSDDNVDKGRERKASHRSYYEEDEESLHLPRFALSNNTNEVVLPPPDGHNDTLLSLTQKFPLNFNLEINFRPLDDCPLPIQLLDVEENIRDDVLFWDAQELLQALSS